mgnify:CR=1 FL=1
MKIIRSIKAFLRKIFRDDNVSFEEKVFNQINDTLEENQKSKEVN